MSLPRKEVRVYFDEPMHRALTEMAALDGVDIKDLVERFAVLALCDGFMASILRTDALSRAGLTRSDLDRARAGATKGLQGTS